MTKSRPSCESVPFRVPPPAAFAAATLPAAVAPPVTTAEPTAAAVPAALFNEPIMSEPPSCGAPLSSVEMSAGIFLMSM